jgi:hypothetical protein
MAVSQNSVCFADATYEMNRGRCRCEQQQASSCGCMRCEAFGCFTPEGQRNIDICCDNNGCCCHYPAHCRNSFWPEFSHPRWLRCSELYNGTSYENPCEQGCCADNDSTNCDN